MTLLKEFQERQQTQSYLERVREAQTEEDGGEKKGRRRGALK